MDWKECVRWRESFGIHDRFTWPSNGLSGFNCEEGVTVSDLTGGFMWTLTYPGDWILSQGPVARFFEMSHPVVGTTASFVFGALLVICAGAYAIVMLGEMLEWIGQRMR